MSSRYTPLPVPTKLEDIPNYLQEELKRISIATNNSADGNFEVNHIAPNKPREGDVRYADGTDWNPGSGAGVYVYTGSAWSKL